MIDPAPYRLFETAVLRVARISRTFLRVTLGGRSLRWFAPWGLDQRIKLVLPHADGGWSAALAGAVDGLTVPQWRRLVLQDPDRHPLRTYTPRAVRPEAQEVDIDFFLHDPAGPASAWAASARPGDRLLVSGPDVRAQDRHHGIQWRPTRAPSRVLLIGDETAVPALAGIGAGRRRRDAATPSVEARRRRLPPPRSAGRPRPRRRDER